EILGLGPRRRDAHGDGFADVAHLLVRERRPTGELVARHRGRRDHVRGAVEVGAGKDLRLGAGRLDDAAGATGRDRAAQERDLALPGQDHVGDEVAAAVQMPDVFLTLQSYAYALRRHASSRSEKHQELSAAAPTWRSDNCRAYSRRPGTRGWNQP